jgi:hypothetical protein
MANEFIVRNGLIAQNNSTITGSLIVTNGITGSLFGTASFSTNATSASFSTTSLYNITSSLTPTSSYAITASFAQLVEFEGKSLSPGYPNNYLMPVKITSPAGTIANTVVNDATANIRYYPIQLSRDTLISSIGALVRGLLTNTTGAYRLGIYNGNETSTLVEGSTSLPGSLLGDYGTIIQLSNTTSFTEIAISPANRPTLKKGLIYWLAIATSGSGTAGLAPNNNSVWNEYFGAIPSTTTITSYVGLSGSGDFGSGLPNPAPTSSLALIPTFQPRSFPMLKITGSIT